MTIRSRALQSCHTDRCVEGVPLRGTSILRLRRAPFGFIGRRPSGQARRLFGWSQTRESLCRTPVSKGLLVSYAILYFHFSSCAFTRIRVRQRAHGFASDDDTEQRFAQLAYWSLRRRVPLRGTSILRLRRAPFGFIGRRPSGQARHLFGWSQTRESLCRTPVSKWLLIWHEIPRSQLILKPATPLFYDASHQNLEPINLKPYAFTTNHAMSER